MKIINDKELSKLKMLHSGRRSAKLEFLDTVQIGQSVLLLKEEWDYKTTPSVLICSAFRDSRSTKKFCTRSLLDKSGWVISRIA